MLMGEGKTTVIAPVLVLLLADANRRNGKIWKTRTLAKTNGWNPKKAPKGKEKTSTNLYVCEYCLFYFMLISDILHLHLGFLPLFMLRENSLQPVCCFSKCV